jgi:Uma2 family endonuclease
MAVEKQLTTLEEFEQFIAQSENREYSFELINGEIAQKISTEERGVIADLIVTEFIFYLKTNHIGRAGVEVRHCVPEDRQNDLIPDVSFISNGRALELTKKGAVPLMPDLVVEVKSPDDSSIGMRENALYYLKNGSRIVWLVFPA